MHETVIWADLRRALREIADGAPRERLVRVTVRLGPLAHLSAATLRDRWGELRTTPSLADAELVVQPGPAPPDPGAAEVRIVDVVLDDAPGG